MSGSGNKNGELKKRRWGGDSKKREEVAMVLKTHSSGQREVLG